MPIIKIDDKDYDFDQLSDTAKSQLASLQFVDAELQRAGMAAVHIVGIDLQRVAQGEISAEAGTRHQRRNTETVDAVAHRILVAIPIRDHHRHPRRHRFDRDDAEGFLNVVREAAEDIGPCPGGLVAVDVAATAQAFVRLFQSSELRQQMGEAGRARAREVYDWAAIIPQYEALWAHLAEIRLAQAKELNPLPHPWPARLDPFHAFASYPTQTLAAQTVLGLVDADAATALQRTLAYRQLAMVDFAKVVLPSEAEIRAVFDGAASGPRAAAELIQTIPAERQPFVFRSLAWLLKLGVLKLC